MKKKSLTWLRMLLWSAIGGMTLFLILLYSPVPFQFANQLGIPMKWMMVIPGFRNNVWAAEIPQMTPQELKQRLDRPDQNFLLIDVRTPEEYAAFHLPGAVLVPVTEIESGEGIQQVKSLLKEQPLIAYCTAGKRSNRALAQLKNAGIPGTNLQGGLRAWRQEIDPSIPEP